MPTDGAIISQGWIMLRIAEKLGFQTPDKGGCVSKGMIIGRKTRFLRLFWLKYLRDKVKNLDFSRIDVVFY